MNTEPSERIPPPARERGTEQRFLVDICQPLTCGLTRFIIERKDLAEIFGSVLTEKQKQEIEKSVNKTIREYGETLKLLGQE